MLVECNCNRRARGSCVIVTNPAKFNDMDAATGPLVWWSCYRHNYWSRVLVLDICAGPVPHNQTCVMEKMSADPVAIMAVMLVWWKYNRHAHWQVAARTDMPAGPVQQYLTFLLVRCNCNIHFCWCDVTNTHVCWSWVPLGTCAGSVTHN